MRIKLCVISVLSRAILTLKGFKQYLKIRQRHQYPLNYINILTQRDDFSNFIANDKNTAFAKNTGSALALSGYV